nr:protein-L-isoaspartate(D-aspartate) O-methyltransferase [uncultured Devosia sp.]
MPDMRAARHDMVALIARRGVTDQRVLMAMETVPRELFVPEPRRGLAYADAAVPIGQGQTISQPYVVALMVAAIAPRPGDRVLEIGTGSGYVAALLGELTARVMTIERHRDLARNASRLLRQLGHDNVSVITADGTSGWPELAPYDGIIVSAFGPEIPQVLLAQLVIGGRLVMPVGRSHAAQQLLRVTRRGEADFVTEDLGEVQFVPLIGARGWPEGF